MNDPALTVPPILTPLEPAEPLIPSGAGFGIRFLARLLDLLMALMMGLVIGFCCGIVFAILAQLGKMPAQWLEHLQRTQWHGYGFGILGQFLYTAMCDGIGGATLGKLICGLTVVGEDGKPCTLGAAFKRDLAYHWDGLFFGLVAYTSMTKGPLQQRYGDVWAKTVVVKKSVYRPNPGRSGGRIFLGLVTGGLILAACNIASMIVKIYA